MATVIARLRQLRQAQRQNQPIIESLEDLDIVLEIGTAQEQGQLVCAKHLLATNLGAPATVRRRLERLVQGGIVSKTKNYRDSRVADLRLSTATVNEFNRLGRTLA